MPKLLRPNRNVAIFTKSLDKQKRKSRKGLYIGAGLVGGAALVGGGLMLAARRRSWFGVDMPPVPVYHQPRQPVSVNATRIYPKPLTQPSIAIHNNQPKQLGYVDAITIHPNSPSNQLLLPAAKQSNSTNPTSSNSLSLTKRQQNSALVNVRKKLYEPELSQLRQARSIKQNLDINPGKYKSKRAGRYKTLRNQRDSAIKTIRQKYDNHR